MFYKTYINSKKSKQRTFHYLVTRVTFWHPWPFSI